MQVSPIKPVLIGPRIEAVPSVYAGGSSIPGKVGGLGRAAMIANFIAMIDEWLADMKQRSPQATATSPMAGAPQLQAYRMSAGTRMALQQVAGESVAATMLLAMA